MTTAVSRVEALLRERPPDVSRLKTAVFVMIKEQNDEQSDSQLLLRAVNALQDRDEEAFRASGRTQRTREDFADTLGFVQELTRRLPPERRMELAMLWYRSGEIDTLVGDSNSAEADFERAHQIMLEAKLDVDLLYVRSVLERADAARRKNDANSAAGLYRVVLSFPYYVEEDGKYTSDFSALYHRAGYGLLDCLRGNRKALEEVRFIPNTDPDLIQRLEQEKKLAR